MLSSIISKLGTIGSSYRAVHDHLNDTSAVEVELYTSVQPSCAKRLSDSMDKAYAKISQYRAKTQETKICQTNKSGQSCAFRSYLEDANTQLNTLFDLTYHDPNKDITHRNYSRWPFGSRLMTDERVEGYERAAYRLSQIEGQIANRPSCACSRIIHSAPTIQDNPKASEPLSTIVNPEEINEGGETSDNVAFGSVIEGIPYLAHMALLERTDIPPSHADSLLWSFVSSLCDQAPQDPSIARVYRGRGPNGRVSLKPSTLRNGRIALSSKMKGKQHGFECCPDATTDELVKHDREVAERLAGGCQIGVEKEMIGLAISRSSGESGGSAVLTLGEEQVSDQSDVFALTQDDEDEESDGDEAQERGGNGTESRGCGNGVGSSVLEALETVRLP